MYFTENIWDSLHKAVNILNNFKLETVANLWKLSLPTSPRLYRRSSFSRKVSVRHKNALQFFNAKTKHAAALNGGGGGWGSLISSDL